MQRLLALFSGIDDVDVSKSVGYLLRLLNEPQRLFVQSGGDMLAPCLGSGLTTLQLRPTLGHMGIKIVLPPYHALSIAPHYFCGQPVIRLMIGAGLRLQEVVCLSREHIDEDGGMVRVRNAVEMIKGRSVLNEGHTKTYDSKRDIPVPEFIRESAVYLREQANPYIWDGRECGTVYNLRTFRIRYTELFSQFTEVRPLTPHCCRTLM